MTSPFTIRRSLCAAAVAGAAVAAGGVSAAGAVTPIPTCAALSSSRVVHSSRDLIVHRSTAPGFAGSHDWACPRTGGGRATLLDDLDPTAERLSRFSTSGRWIADVTTPPEAPRGVALHEVGGGHTDGATNAPDIVGPLHLMSSTDPEGRPIAAVVWVNGRGTLRNIESLTNLDVVRGGYEVGGGSADTLASGAIETGSVRLQPGQGDSFEVSFVSGGQRRTVTVPVNSHLIRLPG